jgi:GNAT superfamily N-acetyltransferase
MTDAFSALREALVGARSKNPGIRWIERPGWLQAINPDGKTVLQNTVLLSEFAAGSSNEEIDAAVDATIGEYRRLGLSFRWITGPWTRPADLGERLLKKGFTLGRMSYGMACKVSDLSVAGGDSGMTIARVDEKNIETWVETYCRAWSIPAAGRDSIRATAKSALSGPGRADYLAFFDGAPAAIACAVFLEQSTYLHSTAVLPDFRRKGIFRSLIRERALEGRRRGRELVTIYAFHDTSYPLLQKMGFETVSECPQYFYYPASA